MTARRCRVQLSPHEVLVIAFYRSLPLARQLEIDGLCGHWWRDPEVGRAFSRNVAELVADAEQAGAVAACDVRPFLAAAKCQRVV